MSLTFMRSLPLAHAGRTAPPAGASFHCR
jgi:hypothetical protein